MEVKNIQYIERNNHKISNITRAISQVHHKKQKSKKKTNKSPLLIGNGKNRCCEWLEPSHYSIRHLDMFIQCKREQISEVPSTHSESTITNKYRHQQNIDGGINIDSSISENNNRCTDLRSTK
jgi:hypothetical protein